MMIEIKIEAPELAEAIMALAEALCASQEVKSTKGREDQSEQKASETLTSTIKLEEVRAKLAALSQSGKQQEVKELIARLGVNKLSEVPADKYNFLLAAMEEIS